VYIPSSITSIQTLGFSRASNLATFYFLGNAPTSVSADAFSFVANGAKAVIKSGATGFANVGQTWNGLIVEEERFTVTYNSASGSAVSSGSFTSGSTIQTAPTSTRAGYTFLGWSTSSNGSVVNFPYTPTATSDITLFAIWSANTNAVTYNAGTGSTVDSGVFTTGGTIQTAPTSTRGGYTFLGWSTSETGSLIEFPYSPAAIADITLFAIWSANTSTVNYNSTGGSSVDPDSFITGGTIQNEPSSTRTGYTFLGWSTSETGSVIEFPYTPTAATNIALFAIWIANTNAVTYNAGFGSSVTSGSFTIGGTIQTAPTSSRPGYTFLGWSTSETGSVIEFPYTPTAATDITLFAIWSVNTNAVTYNAGSGSTVSSGSFTTGGTIQTAPTSTRAGYTLLGWSTSANGPVIEFPYSPAATADITLYAIWSANTNAVTYNSTGGTSVDSDLVTADGLIQAAPVSTRAGHTLVGWSTSENGSVIAFPFDPESNADVTLYAIWSINTYEISFNSQGGSAVANQTLTYGQPLSTAPTPPARTGYVFAGWSTTSTGSTIGFPYTSSGYVGETLYAQWIQKASVTASKPTISGKAASTAKGTNKLTVKPGVWTGIPAPTFTYQWYLCTTQVKAMTTTIPKSCKAITKQTKTSLSIVTAYRGKYLAVKVTGVSTGTPPTSYLTVSSAKVS